MAETKPGPWTRLLKAAREAQGLVAAEHNDQTNGGWDSDDAMQVYEDIECAALDVEESGVDADSLPDLLAAAESLLDAARQAAPTFAERGAASQAFQSQADQMAAGWRDLRAAVAKAKGG
jgi:hypothetical protein